MRPGILRWNSSVVFMGQPSRFLTVASSASFLLIVFAISVVPLFGTLNSQWLHVAAYSHGYPLFILACALAVKRWYEAPPIRLAPCWICLTGVAVALSATAVLELLYVNVPRLLFIPLLIWASAGSVFGRRALQILGWPIALLYLALPIWTVLNGPLQAATTLAVSSALALFGVPVFIEGNFVHIPAGVFEVAEGCSGLRYLIVAMTLVLLYGLAFLERARDRWILFGAAVITAILCNWLRVFVIIAVGQATEMQHDLIVEGHAGFGWVVFGISLIPIMVLANRLSRREAPNAAYENRPSTSLDSRGVFVASLVVLTMALTARLGMAALVSNLESKASGIQSVATSDVAGDASTWQPVFDNAIEHRELIDNHAVRLELYRAEFQEQDREHRLIAYGNSFGGSEWQPISNRQRTVVLGDSPLRVREIEGYVHGERRVIFAWFSVAGYTASGQFGALVLELKGLMDGRRDAAAIAVSARCDTDCATAISVLETYLGQSGAESELLQ